MIITFTGPMHSGKSEGISNVYKKIYNKNNILVFKPKIDTRDLGYVRSLNDDTIIDAICINKLEEILSYIKEDTSNIIIDEIQFLTGDIKVLLYLSIIKDIDIYCAGLNMTSEQEPFGIMPYVLAASDKVINTTASCNICGRNAFYTYYEGNKDKEVVVGDDNYLSLCSKHLRERREKDQVLKIQYPIKKT